MSSDRLKLVAYQFVSVLLLAGSVVWVALSEPPLDLMFMTGLVATGFTLFLGIISEGSCPILLNTLCDARLMSISPEQWQYFRLWHLIIQAFGHFAFVAILAVAGFIVADVMGDLVNLGPIVAAYVVAGVRLGRLAANGASFLWLHIHKIEVSLIPGHRDGASGLAVIGNFYLRQAMPFIVPLGWLSYWVVAIPAVCEYCIYEIWLKAFPFLIAVVFLALAFGIALPSWVVRHRILNWKKRPYVQRRLAHGIDKKFIYDVATLPGTPFSLETVRMATVSVILPILLGLALAVLSTTPDPAPRCC